MSDRRGFTLVEVVIALALIAIAAMTLAVTVASSVRSNEVARERAIAIAAASAKLDSTIGQAAGVQGVLLGLLGQTQTFSVEGLTPRRGQPVGVVTISALTTPLVDVTVTVSWHGIAGDDSVTVSTSAIDGLL